MKKQNQLLYQCLSRDWSVSMTYKKTTYYSIEIYKGSKSSWYKTIFYTDGHASIREVVKKALEFIKYQNLQTS